jgi:hypothetical protein
MKFFWLFVFFAVLASVFSAQSLPATAPGFEQKLHHLEVNGAARTPDQNPTEFSDEEINNYVGSNQLQFPEGVQSVKFEGQPDIIIANTRVDFDRLRAGKMSANPLLSMFSGVHEVVVNAHAHGAGGKGYVNVDTVTLDDVEIPRFVLEAFVEKYVQPKYPGVGLDSVFALPSRVDTAKVGLHKLTLTQK